MFSWVIFCSRTRRRGGICIISSRYLSKGCVKKWTIVKRETVEIVSKNNMFHTTEASGTLTLDYIPFKTKNFCQFIIEMNHFILSRRANANSPLFHWIVECGGTIFTGKDFLLIARNKSLILPHSLYFKVRCGYILPLCWVYIIFSIVW